MGAIGFLPLSHGGIDIDVAGVNLVEDVEDGGDAVDTAAKDDEDKTERGDDDREINRLWSRLKEMVFWRTENLFLSLFRLHQFLSMPG